MYSFLTTEQMIIGLKSFHPIYRMINENHFSNICLIYNPLNNDSIKYIQKFRKFLNRKHCFVSLLEVDDRTTETSINPQIDLIISIGKRHAHDLAKQSNTQRLPHYVVETTRAHMSSYGCGIVWVKDKVQFKKTIPDIVFNDNKTFEDWSLKDFIYYLHNISLALEACMNEKTNDFVIANGINGVVNTLKIYKDIKSTHNKRKLRKLYNRLSYADILCKNAYNNTHLSKEVIKTANITNHYHQFEIAIANESNDVINAFCEKNNQQLNELFNLVGWDGFVFKQYFNEMYTDYINNPKRFDLADDILGKKYKQIMGQNAKTRRIG